MPIYYILHNMPHVTFALNNFTFLTLMHFILTNIFTILCPLPSFLYICFYSVFFTSPWRKSCSISSGSAFLLINYLAFCLSENVFILSSFVKNIFAGYGNLGRYLLFSSFWLLFILHYFWFSYRRCHFSLAALRFSFCTWLSAVW